MRCRRFNMLAASGAQQGAWHSSRSSARNLCGNSSRHASRHASRRGSRYKQQGAALIIAMLVFALATALVVGMTSEFDRFYQRTVNLLFDEQAQAYLRGAEDLASLALIKDYDDDKQAGQARDDLNDLWARPAPDYPLDDIGWLRGSLEDLQGRFNLNSLAKRAPKSGEPGATVPFTAEQEQFIRLLQALGDPAISEQEAIAITESISDWLDADFEPSESGAEDDYYFDQTPAYRAANRPMASVSELRAVAYVTPAIYRALQPYVTVWPQEPEPGSLNIHTAPAMVLRSLNIDGDLNPLSEMEGQTLEEYRDGAGFRDINDFLDHAVFQGRKDRMGNTKALLGQSTQYFLLDAVAEVAGRNTHLYSVLHRYNRKIEVVARASGSL